MPVPVDRSLRLPDTQYFPGSQHKSGIAMHHTVSGSARTSVRLWRRVKGDPAPGALTARYSVVQGDRHGTCTEAT